MSDLRHGLRGNDDAGRVKRLGAGQSSGRAGWLIAWGLMTVVRSRRAGPDALGSIIAGRLRVIGPAAALLMAASGMHPALGQSLPPKTGPDRTEQETFEEVRDRYSQVYSPYSPTALRLAWLSSLKLRADQAFIGAGQARQDPDLLALADARYQTVEGDACSARGEEAENTASNTITLLCQEARYRRLLIKHNVGFWGLTRLRTPSSPNLHFRRVRNLLAELRRFHRDIQDAVDQSVDLGRQATGDEVAAYDVRIEADRGRASVDRLAVEGREARRDERGLALSIEATRREQQNQQIRFDRANARHQAAQSLLRSAVMSGVSQFTGVPLADLDKAVRGDLGSAFVGVAGIPEVRAAVGEFVANNERLTAAFREADGFAKRLKEVKDRYREVRGYVEKGRDVLDVIRNPSIESLARIGDVVIAEVCKRNAAECEERRAKLRERVAGAKPLFLLLQKSAEQGEKGDFVRARLNSVLADTLEANEAAVRAFIETAVRTHVADAEGYYRGLVLKVWDFWGDGEILNRTIAEGLALAARGVVIDLRALLSTSGLRPEDADSVLQLVRSACADDLGKAQKVVGTLSESETNDVLVTCFRRVVGPPNAGHLVEVSVATGGERDPDRRKALVTLRLRTGAAQTAQFRLDKRMLTALLGEADGLVSSGRDQILERTHNLLSVWARQSAQARARVISFLPLQAVDSWIESTARKAADGYDRAFGGPNAQALFDRIMGDTKDLARSDETKLGSPGDKQRLLAFGVLDDLAKVQAGLAAANEANAQSRQAALDAGAPADAQPGSPPGSLEEAYLTAALNAAFPGAGVAVNVVKGFLTSMDALDQMKEAGQKIQAAAEAESRFMDLTHKNEVAQEIIGQETQLALQILKVRDLQLALYSAKSESLQASEAQRRERAQIRLPLFFLTLEQLRESFDLLDVAIQRWAGFEASPSGAIADLIRTDPQNIRYATDSSIHLFTWLGRAGEGTRTDIDAALVHWEQLVRLAEDSCKVVGCDIGGVVTSEVRQTRPLDMRDMMTAQDRARFSRWRECFRKRPENPDESCKDQPDTFAAVVRPRGAQIYTSSADYNLRVVEIRAGYGSPEDLGQFGERLNIAHGLTIRHPGVSTVLNRHGRPLVEYLMPHSSQSFDRIAPFDLAELGLRWNRAEPPQRRGFEGYGLLSDWLILLDAASFMRQGNETAFLRFAYHAMRRDNAMTEAQALEDLEPAKPALDVHEYVVSWTMTGAGLPLRRVERVVDLRDLTFLGQAAARLDMPDRPASDGAQISEAARCERRGGLWLPAGRGRNEGCAPMSWATLAQRFPAEGQAPRAAVQAGLPGPGVRATALRVERRCKSMERLTREYHGTLVSSLAPDRAIFRDPSTPEWAVRAAVPLGLGKSHPRLTASAGSDPWSLAKAEAKASYAAAGACGAGAASSEVLVSFEGFRQ